MSGTRRASFTLCSACLIYSAPTEIYTLSLHDALPISSTPVQTATRALSITIIAASGGCPCTIWPSTARQRAPLNSSHAQISYGVLFRAENNGYITGNRFYKRTGNTGTHVGNLRISGGA